MMEKFSIKYLFFIGTITLWTSCSQKSNYFPKQIEEIQVEVIRFDVALMNVSQEHSLQDVKLLYTDYETFMPIYTENILGISAEDTIYLADALPRFLEDTIYGFKATNAEVKRQFADISNIHKDLNEAFTKIHYLYNDLPIPTIYFYISGFNASILFVENDIAVGTDMYLGYDWPYYNHVVYEYQKKNMRKECLPIDVVSAYLFRNLGYTYTKNRLLENMIYRGKIMYLLSLLLPDYPKYEIMGYTKEEWMWCETHEREIWNTIMDKRDLFKTESIILTSYLNDGPFTSEISQDSPGRLGTWIGWRISESYMHHNKDVTLQQLIANSDAQEILGQSYYKP